MDTVLVSDGAAWSSEKEYSCIEMSPVVKARAMLGNKASKNNVIIPAASI
jgi:hypothetical protein